MNTTLNFKVSNPDRYIEKIMRMKDNTSIHLSWEAPGMETEVIDSFQNYFETKSLIENRKGSSLKLEFKFKGKPLVFVFRDTALKITGEDSLFIRQFEDMLRKSTEDDFISCYSWLKGPDKNYSQMYTHSTDPFKFCENIIKNKNLHVQAYTQTAEEIIELPKTVNIKKLKKMYENKEIVLFRVVGKYMNCKIEVVVFFTNNKIRITCSKKGYLDNLAEEICLRDAS